MSGQTPRPYRNRTFRLAAFSNQEDDDDDIIFVSRHSGTRKSPSPRRLRRQRTPRSAAPPVVDVVSLDNSVDDLRTFVAEPPNVPSTSTGISSDLVRTAEQEAIDHESWEDVKQAMMRLVDDITVIHSKEEEEQNVVRITCPICLETPTSMMATTCGHVFCEGCITEVVKVPRACCPTCRKHLTKKKIHPLYL